MFGMNNKLIESEYRAKTVDGRYEQVFAPDIIETPPIEPRINTEGNFNQFLTN
jgi:hypothetical protein